MKTRDQILADFLARKGATQCPPAETFADQATTLKRSRQAHEARLTDGEGPSIEQESERARERFGAARLDGASVSEAIDFARGR